MNSLLLQVEQVLAQLTEHAETEGRGRVVGAEDVAQTLGLKSPEVVQQRLANAEDAKDLMVQFNIRLVLSICKKYVNRCARDLAQPEGLASLADATLLISASLSSSLDVCNFKFCSLESYQTDGWNESFLA